MLRDEGRAGALARQPVVTYSRRPTRPVSFARASSAAVAAAHLPSTEVREQTRSAVLRSAGMAFGVLGVIGAVAAGVAVVAATFDATVLQPPGLARGPAVAIPAAVNASAPVVTTAPASVAVVVAALAPAPIEVPPGGVDAGSLAASAAGVPPATTSDAMPGISATTSVGEPLVVPFTPPSPRLRPVVPPLPRVASVPQAARPSRTGSSASTEGQSSDQSASAPGSAAVTYSRGGDGVTASVGGSVPSIGPGSPPLPVGSENGNARGNDKGDDNGKDKDKDVAKGNDDHGKGNDDSTKGNGKDGRLGALKQRPAATAVATAAGPRRARAAAASAPIPPALMQIIAANAAASPPNGQVVYVPPQETLAAPGAEVRIPANRSATTPLRPQGPLPPLDVPG